MMILERKTAVIKMFQDNLRLFRNTLGEIVRQMNKLMRMGSNQAQLRMKE